jgi:hypothetical protein
VFPVRYELNSYILFISNPVFKELTLLSRFASLYIQCDSITKTLDKIDIYLLVI